MLWGIVLSFGLVGSVAADSISLFNPNPGSPVTAYEAGVTNDVTTYLLGCAASDKPTGACDFTAPMTLLEGTKTFHVEVTLPVDSGVIQTITVDCPSGTALGCSVTALNKQHVTTTISLNSSMYSLGVVPMPTAASFGALLYNGIAIPTASASGNATYGTNGTATRSGSASGSGSGSGTAKQTGKSTSSSTSSPTPPSKSGAVRQFLGAQAVFVALVAACVLILGW